MRVAHQQSSIETVSNITENGWYRLADGRVAFVRGEVSRFPGEQPHWRATRVERRVPSWCEGVAR
jgi:hypothetical protein